MKTITPKKSQRLLQKYPDRLKYVDNRDGKKIGFPKTELILRSKLRSRKVKQIYVVR